MDEREAIFEELGDVLIFLVFAVEKELVDAHHLCFFHFLFVVFQVDQLDNGEYGSYLVLVVFYDLASGGEVPHEESPELFGRWQDEKLVLRFVSPAVLEPEGTLAFHGRAVRRREGVAESVLEKIGKTGGRGIDSSAPVKKIYAVIAL